MTYGELPFHMDYIIAVDPGPVESAWVKWDGKTVLAHAKQPNDEVLAMLLVERFKYCKCVIEQIRGYGMRVGNETFDTCTWSGRYQQAFGAERTVFLPRKTIATHLCNTATAGDKFIRQALCDRFGGEAIAVGKKKNPGPLHGIAGDQWSALACGITFWDQNVAHSTLAA